MKMMRKTQPIAWSLPLAMALAVGLSACGGGGDGSSTTSVPVTVIDGPLQNAMVCLDKNLNGVCDQGEPSAITDARGVAILAVANAEVGKFPLVAIVTPQSIDADTGPVPMAYVLKAPADASAVVSPLSTLVQTQVETFGNTTAQAAASIAATTGLSASQLSADYTKDSSAAGTAAYTIAQAVVLATQKQFSNGLLAVGTSAIDGSSIAQKDLNAAVQATVAQMLPAIASSALSSTAVSTAANPTARLAALQNVIDSTFIAENGGITSPAGARVVVGVNNTAKNQVTSGAPSYTAVATASLSNLNFTDASHWSARISQKTLSEATLDNTNTYKYRFGHYRNDGAGPTSWGGQGSTPQRGADLHWNGSAWVGCAVNFQNRQTAPDNNGVASYNFCDGLETGTVNAKAPTSAVFDVGTQSMASVYNNNILAANFSNITIGNGTVASANALLGSATFPVGSKLTYLTDVATAYAPAYFPSSGNPGNDNTVVLSSTADGAGGDFTSGTTQTACLSSTASNAPAGSLEVLVARNTGTPCKFVDASVTGMNNVTLRSSDSGQQTRNENWGFTTLNLGTIGTAAVPGSASAARIYYTGNTRLRVAFAANNVAKFYACQQRYDGSTRNCNLLSSGSYSITNLGDGSRTLTFTGTPAIAATLGWSRVFIERNSLVYYGYQNLPATYVSARFNKTAMDALFTQLGLSTVSYFNGLNGGFDPASTINLNALAYAGTYMGTSNATGFQPGSFQVTVGTDGSVQCTGTSVYRAPATSGTAFTCSVVVTPQGTFGTTADISITTNNSTTATGTLDYYTGVITNGNWSTTSPSISGTFTGSRI